MSLIPSLFSDWWENLDEPHSLLDQHFGLGLCPDQLLLPRCPALYCRPWADLMPRVDSGSSMVTADKDQFKVMLDVQQFKPEEINVKVVDNYVVVDAKHEEKRDEHGWVSRQFERRYLMPDQCNIHEVSSSLSSDGVLTITAPRKEEPQIEGAGRLIKIQQTRKPAIKDAPPSAGNAPAEASVKKLETNAK